MFESGKVKEEKLDFHGPFFKANYKGEMASTLPCNNKGNDQ